MKKLIAIMLCAFFTVQFTFAGNISTQVEKKTQSLSTVVSAIFSKQSDKDKYYEPLKMIFGSCAKTCKDEINKQASANIMKNIFGEGSAEEKLTEDSIVEKVEEDGLLDPTETFEFYSYNFTLKDMLVFNYDDRGHEPEYDKFVVLEGIIEYTSDYAPEDIVLPNFILSNGKSGHLDDSRINIGGKVGYNQAIKFKDNSWNRTSKFYKAFDVKDLIIGDSIIIIQSRDGRGEDLKFDGSKLEWKIMNDSKY